MNNSHVRLVQDISPRERAKEEAPPSVQRAISQGMSNGRFAVVVTDHTKAGEPVAYVNRAFEELTGYKLAEVIGIRPHFLMTDDREQVGVKAIEAAIYNGTACTAVLRDYHKDRTPVWYKVCVQPVFSKSGQLTHFFGVLKDVTAEVEASDSEVDWQTLVAGFAHDPLCDYDS